MDCLVEQQGHVLVVTMNRPEARNALSAEMMAIMRSAWDQVDNDESIRACVLTGAGGAFCAGADLKAMTSSHPGDTASDWDLSVIEPLLKGRRLTLSMCIRDRLWKARRSRAEPRSCKQQTSA